MIRTVRIEVNAAYPDMPLERAAVYTGSAASFTVINVPRKHGSREITGVAVSVTSVAEVTQSFAAVRDGCAWNVTVPASAIGASGKVTRGLVVTASGTDENGAAVSCWVLGCGDIEILPLDAQPTPGETATTLRGFDETPSAPAKWNVRRSDGGFEIFYGDAWLPLGGGDMKHSEFADLNAPDNMTQKESNALLQTIVSRLKGSTPMLLAPLLVLASLLASAVPLSPSTDFGDVNPTNKLGEVVSAAGAVDTNAVIDIANATIATNPVVVGKLDKTDGIGSISWNNGSLNANAATVSCGGGFTTLYDFQIKESPSAQPTHALSAKANRAESGHADEIATLDADGNPTRSGIAKDDVATVTGISDGSYGAIFSSLAAPMVTINATGFSSDGLNGRLIDSGGRTYAALSDIPAISATDPTFSNAVLAVGISTNLVASIGELNDFIHGYGELGATSVGGLILALAAAVALLRKKTAKLDNSGNATDAFATDLLGKQVAKEAIDEEIIEKGTAPDAHLEAPTDEHLKLILADNSVAYDSAKALPYKLTSVIGDRVIATMTLTAASTDITLPTIAANDTTVKDFILDVTNAYAVEGVATDAGINIPRTDFKLVTRDGESLTAVTTVKAGKSAFICFTQKSPVVVDGTTYPCWCVIQLPFGDPS